MAEIVDSLAERIACRPFIRNCMYRFTYILWQPGFVFLLKIFDAVVVAWLIIKFDTEENTIPYSRILKNNLVFTKKKDKTGEKGIGMTS